MIVLTKFLGIHHTLPLAELEAVFQAEKIDYWLIETFSNYAIHEVRRFKQEPLERRLALTHAMFEVLSDLQEPNAKELVATISVRELPLPYAVRIDKIEEGMGIDYSKFLKEVADEIWKAYEDEGINPSVDLKTPATEFWVFVGKDFVILSRKLFEVDKKQFKASMFIWAEMPEKYKKMSSMKFSELLMEKASVSVSPGAGFGEAGEGYVRMALVENEMRIKQAIRNINKVLKLN